MLFKDEAEKRKFLEIKEDDSPDIAAMKSELLLAMDMKPHEKAIFLQDKRVAEANGHLRWMIDCNKRDDEFIAYAIAKAKKLMQDLKDYGHDPAWLAAAETWTDIAQGTKANKFTLSDIRKQRERIWQHLS